MAYQTIVNHLGAEADYLLEHECKTISKSALQLPSPYFVDQVFDQSNRNIPPPTSPGKPTTSE